jgi:hypothetical protein
LTGADLLSPEEACDHLGVDAWCLKRLMALGEFEADAEDRLPAKAVDQLAADRKVRRGEALNDLAALDGPFMGQTP